MLLVRICDPRAHFLFPNRHDPLARVCNAGALRINKIQWTVSGKVKAVTRTTGSTLQPLEFAYGASGQRISKQVGGAVGDPGTFREHKRPSRSGFWK